MMAKGIVVLRRWAKATPTGMTKSDEPIRPMTLENMRQNGVRGLFVTCSACGHHTYVDFTRATNLSMLDSVVAKEVTKRTRT